MALVMPVASARSLSSAVPPQRWHHRWHHRSRPLACLRGHGPALCTAPLPARLPARLGLALTRRGKACEVLGCANTASTMQGMACARQPPDTTTTRENLGSDARLVTSGPLMVLPPCSPTPGPLHALLPPAAVATLSDQPPPLQRRCSLRPPPCAHAHPLWPPVVPSLTHHKVPQHAVLVLLVRALHFVQRHARNHDARGQQREPVKQGVDVVLHEEAAAGTANANGQRQVRQALLLRGASHTQHVCKPCWACLGLLLLGIPRGWRQEPRTAPPAPPRDAGRSGRVRSHARTCRGGGC